MIQNPFELRELSLTSPNIVPFEDNKLPMSLYLFTDCIEDTPNKFDILVLDISQTLCVKVHICKRSHWVRWHCGIAVLPWHCRTKDPWPWCVCSCSRGRQEGLDAGEPWCHCGGVCHLEASGVPGNDSPRGPAGALPLRAGQDRSQR